MLSCNRNSNTVNEGELVYKITYLPENGKENTIIALLPKTVTIKFKNDNTAIHVNGFWNTFELKFIKVAKEKKSYTTLKIWDKKYYTENHIDSINAGYSDLKTFKIIKNSNDTLSFAGFHSLEADVYCKELSDSVIKIYYTYDIGIKNSNSNTPFKEIDGVLTKFQTKVAGINMIFELIELNSEAVDDSEFDIPENYKKVSKNDLNKILQSFNE